MKDARYYIYRIMNGNYTDEEWQALNDEVQEWLKECSEEQERIFRESGAGETLYMCL
ncbi:MAG: hypothetical protein IJ594_04400 [Oscillospiraceae bacterium]|nr:hypothetical protein [Oscillospiraceae bacterium]